MNNPDASEPAGIPKGFRRLKWNEVVSHGDFVADDHQGIEPWEGPGGFRADSFVKAIFRKLDRRPSRARKLE